MIAREARRTDPQDAAPADASLDVEAARARVAALASAVPPPVVAQIPLQSSLGRVLAQDVVAGHAIPPFDTALTDGYAIRRMDLAVKGPYRFRITRTVRAGSANRLAPVHATGTALRIMSGAPVPAPYDAVIPCARVTEQGGWVAFADVPAPYAGIRRLGAVAMPDAPLLEAGHVVGPRDLGLLAAADRGEVSVRRKLRVAVLSTGSELVDAGEGGAHGQVPDTNRPILLAELARPWIAARDLGIVGDDKAMLGQVLDIAAGENRIVVTTGGAATGPSDHLRDCIGRLGGEIVIPRVAMKPGGGTFVARLRGAVFLCLPGDPVAAYLGLQVLGWPLLRAAAGVAEPEGGEVPGIAGFTRAPRPDRDEFPPVGIAGRTAAGHPILDMPSDAGAAHLRDLAEADGYARFGADAEGTDAGQRIAWTAF